MLRHFSILRQERTSIKQHHSIGVDEGIKSGGKDYRKRALRAKIRSVEVTIFDLLFYNQGITWMTRRGTHKVFNSKNAARIVLIRETIWYDAKKRGKNLNWVVIIIRYMYSGFT